MGAIQVGATFHVAVWEPSAACAKDVNHRPCPLCLLRDRREAHNLMTTAGLVAIAAAFNWSGVFAQNTAIGGIFSQSNALSVTAGTLDVYGAVGTSVTAPTATDSGLGNEIARLVISNANFGLNTATWDFFFGIGAAAGVLTEIGVFSQANSTPNSGTLLDHALLNPAVTVALNQTVTFEAAWAFVAG